MKKTLNIGNFKKKLKVTKLKNLSNIDGTKSTLSNSQPPIKEDTRRIRRKNINCNCSPNINLKGLLPCISN